MRKVRLPILIQDSMLNKDIGRVIEGYDSKREFFLDGPITDNVAVLDFDPTTGKLNKGVKFKKGKKRGWFEDKNRRDIREYGEEEIYSPAFMQASTFATVLKTIDLFTDKRTMGRPLTWAFNSPQLFIIPRAGEMANAYYHRDSHSIQFFFFPSEKDKNKIIYSCLSRDIIAHETGHAIIDGIAPALLNTSSPQSLAIHEALADIIAMAMAFRSHNLARYVLNRENGSIKDLSEFSTIAEEFGQARGHKQGLRNLLNKKNLDPDDHINCVKNKGPHELSEVLSGALYQLMIMIHEDLKNEYKDLPRYKKFEDPVYSASGFALGKGLFRLIRIIFRALDYLPYGCASFRDFGRAMIAVDEIAYPKSPKLRNRIRKEFLNRSIISDENDLSIPWDPNSQSIKQIDLSALSSSDWIAYEYANTNRKLIGIPEEIPFKVHPRLDVTKRYDNDIFKRECIFKVSWDQEENNPVYPSLPTKRKITVGSTIAFDWETGEILTILSNAKPPSLKKGIGRGVFLSDEIRKRRQKEYDKQKSERDQFIVALVENGLIKFGDQAIGPDGKPLALIVQAEVVNEIMRIKNSFNMLHIAGVEL